MLARYAYDVLGRRIVKRVYSGANAGFLRMIYRGDAVAAEADDAGVLTLGYTSGLGVDNLVAIHRYATDSDYYVVQDALHSARGLSRRDGTWIASWRYGIYGAAIDSAGGAPFAIRYRWTGRELDVETGLYYFRARYYDPTAQRFVQEDPIGFAGGTNLYAYGDGNPTNGRDATGLRLDPETIIPPKETLNPHWGGGGRSFEDWNGDGYDDWYYFTESSWESQRTGLSLAQLEYAWAIGADTYSGIDREGRLISGSVPHLGDPFVNSTITGVDPAQIASIPLATMAPWRTCGVQLFGSLCDDIDGALSYLQNSGVQACRDLGYSAQDRFDAGGFLLWDLGPGRVGAYYGPLTILTPLAFGGGVLGAGTLLPWAIAHEEAHHQGLGHAEQGRQGFAQCAATI